jgi:hypothetical protein
MPLSSLQKRAPGVAWQPPPSQSSRPHPSDHSCLSCPSPSDKSSTETQTQSHVSHEIVHESDSLSDQESQESSEDAGGVGQEGLDEGRVQKCKKENSSEEHPLGSDTSSTHSSYFSYDFFKRPPGREEEEEAEEAEEAEGEAGDGVHAGDISLDEDEEFSRNPPSS